MKNRRITLLIIALFTGLSISFASPKDKHQQCDTLKILSYVNL